MKKNLIFLLLLVSISCSQVKSYFTKESPKKGDIKGYVALTDEEISLYMGYQSAMLLGDLERAENLIKELIKKKEDFIDPYLDLITIFTFQKKLNEAEEVIVKLENMGVENESLLSSKANIYLMKGDLGKAIPILNKIIEKQPDKENIYLILANIYYQNKDYKNAMNILEKLIKVIPNSFFGNLYLGKVYETLEDNKKAAEFYERAFKEREEDEILMNLDRVYDKLGERLKSIEVLEKFLSLNPDYPKVRERLALLYVGENNYDKALMHFEILLNQFPENIDLNLKAGFVAIEGKNYDKAENFLKNVLNKEPDNQKGLYFYGILMKDQKRWKEAIEYFEKIKEQDYLKPSLLYLAVCYEKINNKDKAKEILEKLWQSDPDEDVGYFLSLYYKNIKDYNNALKILDKLIEESKGKNYKLIYLKSEILIKRGEFEKGINLVEQILNKEPDNPDALNFIGYSYAERGIEIEKAYDMIQKALSIKKDDPYIMDSLAWVYYVKGEYEKALSIQKKVIEKVKDDPTILEHLGDILKALGMNKEALDTYKKALENEPEQPDLLIKKIMELENK